MIKLFDGAFQIPSVGPLFIEGKPNSGKTALAEGIWFELCKNSIPTRIYSGEASIKTEDELVRAMIKAHESKDRVLILDDVPSDVLSPTPNRNIQQDLMDACLRLNISLILFLKIKDRQNPYASFMLIPRDGVGILANTHRHEFFEFRWVDLDQNTKSIGDQGLFIFSKVSSRS